MKPVHPHVVYRLYNSCQGMIVCAKMSSKDNSMFMSEYGSEGGFAGAASGKEPICQCRRLK